MTTAQPTAARRPLSPAHPGEHRRQYEQRQHLVRRRPHRDAARVGERDEQQGGHDCRRRVEDPRDDAEQQRDDARRDEPEQIQIGTCSHTAGTNASAPPGK
jgi:hypothetical protein